MSSDFQDSRDQAEALKAWSHALDMWSQLPGHLQKVAKEKIGISEEESILKEGPTLTSESLEARGKKVLTKEVGDVSVEEPEDKLFAVYRKFSSGSSSVADEYGGGHITGGEGDYYREIIGVADSRANAAQIILQDAYIHSLKHDVYSGITNEVKNYRDGVDSVSFSLASKWEVQLIEVNRAFPHIAGTESSN